MQALILAGGLGTRLRSVVSDVPKPMAPIQGRPFLAILLRALARKGITRAVLSVGHMHEKIVDHFGSSFEDMALAYEIEPHPLGTGGAIAAALRQIDGDHALVLNGDTYLDLEIDALESTWLAKRAPIVVGRAVDDTSRYGRLQHDGRGTVTGFSEKGMTGPGLINAGAYVLPTDLFARSPLVAPFSIETDVLVPLAAEGALRLFVTESGFIDIGVPEDFRRAQSMRWD